MERLPPMEGGWGWMVVLGSCISHLLMGAVVRSMGVIYLLFLDRFNTSATVAAWFTALPLLLWTGLGPLTTTLCEKYSCRMVTLLGSLLLSAGLFSAAFVTNPAMLFLTFGLVSGTGLCFIYVPGYLIVGEYFDKKKGVAMALSTIGSGIGAFAFPPLIQVMFEHYGYRGCFIILSSITLNGMVGGFLFRPYKDNKFVKRVIRERKLQALNSTTRPLLGGEGADKTKAKLALNSKDTADAKLDEDNNLMLSTPLDVGVGVSSGCGDKERVRHASRSVENITITLNGEKMQQEFINGSALNMKRKSMPGDHLTRMSKSNGALPMDYMYSTQRRPSSVSQMKMMTKNLAASLNKLSQSQTSCATYSLLEAPVDPVNQISEVNEAQIDTVDCTPEKSKKKKIFHWGLLKKEAFLVICLLGITSNATFAITVNFLPGLGKDNSMTSKEGAFLLSLLGLGDTIGRLPVGILFDLPVIKVRRNMIYGLFMTVNGIVTFLMPVTVSSKWIIYAVCIIRGLTSGVFMSQRATILADMIGIDMVANAFGMQLLIMTLGALLARMAGGGMKDLFGHYDLIFYCTGAILVASTLVFCGYIYCSGRRARRDRRMSYGLNLQNRRLSETRIRAT